MVTKWVFPKHSWSPLLGAQWSWAMRIKKGLYFLFFLKWLIHFVFTHFQDLLRLRVFVSNGEVCSLLGLVVGCRMGLDHTKHWSGFTPRSEVWNHSWRGSENHMGCQGSHSGQSHAKQIPLPTELGSSPRRVIYLLLQRPWSCRHRDVNTKLMLKYQEKGISGLRDIYATGLLRTEGQIELGASLWKSARQKCAVGSACS